ncbi:hypothetical protein ACMHYJ_03545 [Castellaniella hirudinis]|uniref:hypothetical protein n=1 Tax=Castellaniella hirudinis TaxID=1144617 RepID=UPI0039C01C59
MTWRYILARPAIARHQALASIRFNNRWLTIEHGLICVREGYAWDGCSPAIRIPGTRRWLGPPDGPLMDDGRPAAWRASCFHDALCQFRHQIPGLTRDASVAVFAAELADAPAWMRWLYPPAVRWLGPQSWPV